MSRYELLLFLHVTSVIVWLGTGTTLALTGAFAARRRDRALLRQLPALGEWLGPRVVAPAALGSLVFGILLVVDGHWTFGPLWIKVGLAAFAASFLLNAGLRLRAVRRLERAASDEEAEAAGHRLALPARLELGILYLTVADMASKPTTGDTGTIAAGGAIVALLVLSVVVDAIRTPRSRRMDDDVARA